MPTEPAVEDVSRLQHSSRDVSTLPDVMSGWLSTVMPAGVSHPGSPWEKRRRRPTACPSETIILTGRWEEDGQQREEKWGGARGTQRWRTCRCSRRIGWTTSSIVIRLVGGEDRRPRSTGAVARIDRLGARHSVLPDGLRRGPGATRRDCRTRSATTGSPTPPPRRSSANCRTAPSR